MPTSRSPRRRAEAAPRAEPQRSRLLWPLMLVGALLALTVVIIVLPASLVTRVLPPWILADDFSGNLWHGSAGRLVVDTRAAGAIEWHLHPASLLSFTLAADLHWVKVGFVADAAVDVDRHGMTARNLHGGGPIADLSDFGVAAGWHGTTDFNLSEIRIAFPVTPADRGRVKLLSAVGELNVSDLAARQIADGADLGGYVLRIANGASLADVDATAELDDTGGPIELKAVVHFSAEDHVGLLSGTVRERPGAPAALRAQLENLAQLHARDAQGRIPVELEFTL